MSGSEESSATNVAALPRPEGGRRPHAHVSVVLVTGTQTRGRQLEKFLNGPGFATMGVAKDAEGAVALVQRHKPSAVLLDLDLFGGGLETIERIMATRPTPIVVCGAASDHPEAAIAAGAVDVVGALDAAPGSSAYVEGLRRHLTIASRVSVITHPRARLRARMAPRPGVGATSVDSTDTAALRVVAIGASTGGPPALATVLGELPDQLGAAVVVVQHMAEGFVEGLARWLDGICRLRVVVAADGERLLPDTVYLAPAGLNLVVRRGMRIELCEPDARQFHVPGVDHAFRSIAEVCQSRAVGVLLTGMGRDGAAGMLALRQAGAMTIGQDEPTSVVYGMPAAAAALDAVDLELPLGAIAGAVLDGVAATYAGPVASTGAST